MKKTNKLLKINFQTHTVNKRAFSAFSVLLESAKTREKLFFRKVRDFSGNCCTGSFIEVHTENCSLKRI